MSRLNFLNVRSYGSFTASLRRLLVALTENAALLPDIAVERAVVEQALSAAEEAKTRQDAFKGGKQVATQDLKAALARAKDATIQLQNAAKFKLGPRNEKLVVFQIAPLRKRTSNKGSKLKEQEEALRKQGEDLQKQENELLKKEVELLKNEAEPAPAS